MLYDGPEACDHTTMAAMMHALRTHGGASVGTSGGAATTAGRGRFQWQLDTVTGSGGSRPLHAGPGRCTTSLY